MRIRLYELLRSFLKIVWQYEELSDKTGTDRIADSLRHKKSNASYGEHRSAVQSADSQATRFHLVIVDLPTEGELQKQLLPRKAFIPAQDSIGDFAEQILSAGEEYSSAILRKFGKELSTHVRNYDIVNIEAVLNSYPNVIEKIRAM